YATKILELSLSEAKKIGIKKALLTCSKDNIGSAKVIQKNGGIFRKEQLVDGKPSLSFWIEIK
ncbi:MAG: GNAT family acetyltransferase, partial [Bacteroidota bacterium]